MAEPTKLNVELALLPRVVMAAMQTTTIRASITAYSTAVGPSSFLMKFTKPFVIACITSPVLASQGDVNEPELRTGLSSRSRARQQPLYVSCSYQANGIAFF